MAKLQPTAPVSTNVQFTITGATSASTLIVDLTQTGAQGISYYWEVHVQSVDADAGDTVTLGFTEESARVATGWTLGIFADDSQAHKAKLVLPPHGKLYANCADGETRDLRILATPILN